jgi:hypothetical protein
MLGEIDTIASDWGSLAWALGCTGALVRHIVPRHARVVIARSAPSTAATLRIVGKRTAETASGVAIAAGLLCLSVLGVVRMLHTSWEQFAHAPLTDRAMVMAALQILLVVTAVALWRPRRFVAAGVAAAAITLLVHFAAHGG